ncbi:substrate-binding periplasmic protein [Pseudoduganella violaceinigra]|uniref:substrate-binding periplasmic protein n=1 Tax=Pseudoduganella violaceinigra TaxID=246602 RepID=UPI0013766D27|nr:transporter substrate-binding domain-containing protein [Pseudoduganella violaceinigra]
MRLFRLFAFACLLMAAPYGRCGELVVLVDRAADMPMARIENGLLIDGVHKLLGEALARSTGREVRFLLLPRKRIAKALQKGEADILCGYAPQWIEGDYLWSEPVFTAEEVLVTAASEPRPLAIADLRGQPIGTILGYQHPEIETVLGTGFARENSPNMEINFEKLARGRVHHILIARAVLDYRQRLRAVPLKLHPPLPAASFKTRCAVSRQGHLSLAEANHAIATLTRDGTLAQILAQFR